MAYEGGVVIDHSFAASGDLSAAQYRAVHLNSSQKLVLSDSEADAPLGILQNDPAADGRGGSTRLGGISKAYCSGTIAVLDRLVPSGNGTTSGYLITTTTDKDMFVAIALQPHTADGAETMLSVLVERGTLSI